MAVVIRAVVVVAASVVATPAEAGVKFAIGLVYHVLSVWNYKTNIM